MDQSTALEIAKSDKIAFELGTDIAPPQKKMKISLLEHSVPNLLFLSLPLCILLSAEGPSVEGQDREGAVRHWS